MDGPEIPDALFREVVFAIDAGDPGALQRLLSAHPRLPRDRIDCGAGYFRRQHLLWFMAENPVGNGTLPENVAHVARTIVEAAKRQGVDSLREQPDGALGLVRSGRVARECGVPRGLIEVLVDAGAAPDCLTTALAHRELDAAERLLERGASLTLPAAVCTGRTDDVARLPPAASGEDRQLAPARAALDGLAGALAALIDRGVGLDACSPPGFHPHGTALHHAVDSGSLDAVKVLVEAGARLGARDRLRQETPLDWAESLRRVEIGTDLRAMGSGRRDGRPS